MSAAADAGSVYEPHPCLTYNWDPNYTPSGDSLKRQPSSRMRGQSFDLEPHPADPMSIAHASPEIENGGAHNGSRTHLEQRRVDGQELYVYYGHGG